MSYAFGWKAMKGEKKVRRRIDGTFTLMMMMFQSRSNAKYWMIAPIGECTFKDGRHFLLVSATKSEKKEEKFVFFF